MSETDLVKRTLLALCKEFPQGLWYRRNTGAMKTESGFVRFGLPGMADIGGIMTKAYELEAKIKTKQRPEQILWQKAVERAGGVYILFHTVEECISAIRQSTDPQR
jgi:hypothetical protein